MAAHWDIDIITTRARDYLTWEDYYPEGDELIDGVTVKRFSVDQQRVPKHFDSLSQFLLPRLKDAPLDEQEAWMKAQGPYSTRLFRYIEENRDTYDLFFFFTYLYATTYFGLPLVADKAVLAPFAHDEWPIYAPFYDRLFTLPAAFVFSTPEERAFLKRRFPAAPLNGKIIGIGIDEPVDAQPGRFRRRFGIDGPYALYLGRIDPSKGCERLFDAFGSYKQAFHDDLLLVLAGRPAMPIPQAPYLRAVGFVEEGMKMDAVAGAEMVVMPSALESLSIVLLEAWSARRPVLVSAESDVMVGQARRSNGGLWFEDDAEFVAAAHLLRSQVGRDLGESGYRFVQKEYRWERIVEQYSLIAASLLAPMA